MNGLLPFAIVATIAVMYFALTIPTNRRRTMPHVEPLEFELQFRREAYRKVGATMVRDEEQDAKLPSRPPQFTELRGDHATVTARADHLNKAQTQSGFLHYFFYPEMADAKFDAGHCDTCRRLSRRYPA